MEDKGIYKLLDDIIRDAQEELNDMESEQNSYAQGFEDGRIAVAREVRSFMHSPSTTS